MTDEVITMSQKEIDRLEMMQKLVDKRITQKEAAEQLHITPRHMRRLQKRYTEAGPSGLVSQHRGRPSNHRLPDALKQAVIRLAKEEQYQGFGPTFLLEKLTSVHQLDLSVESLRKLMIQADLWHGKQRKKTMVHQSRTRRSQFGELIQLDGSPHAWFEDRGPQCCLHVLIDDATSKITALHFAEQECTQAYFTALEQHLKAYGRPLSTYSDRHSIFRVNMPEAKSGNGETQFGRALRELDIELICANSPQAKGRVERVNRVLQDRLVKELRLRGISDIESANAFLPEYIKQHNQQFAVKPHSAIDAHRQSMPEAEELDLIFSEQHTRRISKNLEVSFRNQLYQIQVQTPSYTMRGARLSICEKAGVVTLLYKQRSLAYKILDKHNRPAPVESSKGLTKRLEKSRRRKPAADHPWRSKYKQSKLKQAC